MKPKRWTKKDLEILRNQFSTFVLQYELYAPKEAIRKAIEENRQVIVLNGLASFRSLLSERKSSDEETARHFEAHPSIYGESNPEMIERFRTSARDLEKDLKKLDSIVERIQSEGLPEEVLRYMPERVL